MGLHEDDGDTDRNGGARQDGHKFTLSAALGPLPTRLLHGMGGIEDHGITGLGESRQAAHIRDQGVVAEADAPLADQDLAVARRLDLLDDLLHVPGRQELALLDVHGPPGFGGGHEKIGLAR